MKKLIPCSIAIWTGLASCGGDPGEGGPVRRLPSSDVVAVTSGPAQWLAGLVLPGGQWDAVAPNGARPENWRPTDAELDRLISARKIFLVGEEFEPWTQRAGLPPSRVVSLVGLADPAQLLKTEGITHTHGTGPAHSHGGTVPTVWTDPELLQDLLPKVAKALASAESGSIAPAREPETARELEIPGLTDYRAALRELESAAKGRGIIASGHGLEYIGRATGIEIRVALLEPDDEGPTNDLGRHQLEGLAKKPDDSGLLVWLDPPPAPFVGLVKAELGLSSVHFDLGGAAGSPTLEVLTKSTRRLTAALQP